MALPHCNQHRGVHLRPACGIRTGVRAATGGSSLHQGYGGALNVWGDRFEGNVGVGYLDGVRLSVFLKRLVGTDTLRLGNDMIPVRFVTDVFGSSHSILAQGAGIRRGTKRSQLYAFVGASANATPAPFVNALRHDQIVGIVQGVRQLSPAVRTTMHALFSSRQTILQGIEWTLPNGLELGSIGGVGGNQPYASASLALPLLQVLTHANDRTSVSFGGTFATGLTSLGLDYQVVHTPYRPSQPFVPTVALTVRLPLGNYRVNASSFVSPDGRVNYAGFASTFFYAGDVLTGATKPVEIRFERFIVEGTVVDEAGASVDGAAIAIGNATVFSDSRGHFFLRLPSNRVVSVRVALEEFITDGYYETVGVPASVRPTRDGQRAPIRVVVRRLHPERVQDGADSADTQPGST